MGALPTHAGLLLQVVPRHSPSRAVWGWVRECLPLEMDLERGRCLASAGRRRICPRSSRKQLTSIFSIFKNWKGGVAVTNTTGEGGRVRCLGLPGLWVQQTASPSPRVSHGPRVRKTPSVCVSLKNAGTQPPLVGTLSRARIAGIFPHFGHCKNERKTVRGKKAILKFLRN